MCVMRESVTLGVLRMKNKRIIFYVTRQYMKKNMGRTITTFLGIMFMVVLMTCVFVGRDTVFSYLQRTAELSKGMWHVNVYNVDEKQYEKISNLPYVEETACSYDMGYTKLDASMNQDKPYLLVKAYSAKSFDWMNIEIAEGRLPENENEIVISKAVNENGENIKIGDSISAKFFTRAIRGIAPGITTEFPFYFMTVKYNEEVLVSQDFPYFGENDSFEEVQHLTGDTGKYTVVGFFEVPEFEGKDTSFYTGLTYTDNAVPVNGRANLSLRLDMKQSMDNLDYWLDISEICGGNSDEIEINDMVLVFSSKSSQDNMNKLVNAVVIFFLVLILIISVVLIYNVFNISYEERRKYLGMLASVGATRTQKRSSVYYEALLLLTGALPTGFLLGLGIVKLGMELIVPSLSKMADGMLPGGLMEVPTTLKISPANILIIVLFSIITVLISAYLPARKIGKTGPIESIRGNEKQVIKKFRSNKRAFRKGKAELLLATNQLNMQRYKTKGMIRAMSVFMLVVIITTFGANSVTKIVRYKLIDSANITYGENGAFDYCLHEVREYGKTYSDIKNEIMADSEAFETEETYTGFWVGDVDSSVMSREYWDCVRTVADMYSEEPLTDEEFEEYFSYGTPMSVLALPDDVFLKLAKKCDVDMSIAKDTDLNPVIFFQNLEISTDNFRFSDKSPKRSWYSETKRATDLSKGDTMNLTLSQEGTRSNMIMTIAGYATNRQLENYAAFHGEFAWIIVSASTAERMNDILKTQESVDENGNEYTITRTLNIRVKDPEHPLATKLEEMSLSAHDEFGVTSGNYSQIMVDIAYAINLIINLVTYSFIVFSSFVCLLNLFNSIRARADERNRDMAMLRSMGMIQKQINRMLFHENIRLIGKSILWAVGLSIPLLYGMRYVFISYFGRVEFPMPFFAYGLAFTIVILSLFGISSWCYRTKENGNILEEMRRETI